MIKSYRICKNDSVPGIFRDESVNGRKAYIGSQGCSTIWYISVPAARKALFSRPDNKDEMTGADLYDCTQCGCHYPAGTPEHKEYPEFACRKVKEAYARAFE